MVAVLGRLRVTAIIYIGHHTTYMVQGDLLWGSEKRRERERCPQQRGKEREGEKQEETERESRPIAVHRKWDGGR